MKKKKNVLPEFSVMHKIRLGAVRAEQVCQGFFDGRFRTRAVKSSKVYNRKKRKFQDRNSEYLIHKTINQSIFYFSCLSTITLSNLARLLINKTRANQSRVHEESEKIMAELIPFIK